jgi:large subunit ribosomal protein L19
LKRLTKRYVWGDLPEFLISKLANSFPFPIFAVRFKNHRVMADLIKVVEQEFAKVRESIPNFKPGDTINVHVKIKEGNKERVQQFQGTVIQRRGKGTNGESFTVRKISNGVGVERIFPIVSPSIDKIEIVKEGKVRRAKLYYMKGRQGKSARIKEKI